MYTIFFKKAVTNGSKKPELYIEGYFIDHGVSSVTGKSKTSYVKFLLAGIIHGKIFKKEDGI